VAVPGMMHMPDDLKRALAVSGAVVVIGPRSGVRDATMRIPVPLPPDLPGLDVTVSRVETMRADMPLRLANGGAAIGYREVLEGAA
jgi:beta-galactosidase